MTWTMYALFLCSTILTLSFSINASAQRKSADFSSTFHASRERALSFLRTGERHRRDLRKKCNEARGCSYEEIQEVLETRQDPTNVCVWMKQKLCHEAACGSGYDCVTSTYNCSNIRNFHVKCEATTQLSDCGSADILFIMDGSGSIKVSNFGFMKDFVTGLVQRFSLLSNVRFASITFSTDVNRNFGFKDHHSLHDTLSAINRINCTSGETNTEKALKYARESIFTASKENSSKIVILLTDGQSENMQKTVLEATKLKNDGVRILPIGVGSKPNVTELHSIASDPTPEYVFTVPSFAELDKIRNAVAKSACKVANDGGFSDWSPWSSCSVSCNNGTRTRTRSCTNPAPSNNGKNCSGEYQQSSSCQESPCPVDGGFSTWSTWSSCSATCGGGQRNRSRTCTNPEPQFGGRNCSGSTVEMEICSIKPCPLPDSNNGGFSDWSSWSSCSVSCNNGTRTRTRSCTNPAPSNNGKNCSGEYQQSSSCQESPCPVDGGFSTWMTWNSCSATCGVGQRNRSRACTNPEPQFGGRNCSGSTVEMEICSIKPCPLPASNDGGFSDWSSWSSCSVSCNNGTRTRTRSCTNPAPSNNGKNCSGEYQQSSSCQESPCPVDGGFSTWSTWSTCSATCGGGQRNRSRTCTNPEPQFGGRNCSGSTVEMEICSIKPCPLPASNDGGFSDWSPWSSCSVSCNNGTRTRTRSCTNPAPSNNGKNCSGEYQQSSSCQESPCPVDGGFSTWLTWSSCSATCGGGQRNRSRTCTNPEPQYGGRNCTGSTVEMEICSIEPCPLTVSNDGGFSDWSSWSSCSVSCNNGTRTRTRSCTNPAPSNNGKNCSGEYQQSSFCQESPCPVDGGFSTWSTWSSCSAICGGGQRNRSRTCTNPEPQFGGRNCSGMTVEMEVCSIEVCPLTDCGSADILFALDDSGSIKLSNFRIMKNFVASIIKRLFSANKVRFSSITFSKNVKRNFGFGDHNSLQDILSAVSGIRYTKGITNTHKALQYARESIFSSTKRNTSKILILLTDGKSSNTSKTVSEATQLKNQGVRIFSIGVGSEAKKELYEIASKPNTDHVFTVASFTALDQIRNAVTKEICGASNDGEFSDWSSWSPCSVSCNNGIRTRTRTCTNPAPSNNGKNCSGEYQQSSYCQETPCLVDDGLSKWSTWSSCSATCGGGQKNRSRTCNNPQSQFGARNCSGSRVEMEDCSTESCPLTGCGPADILFIMDDSGSITISNFETMKIFVTGLIKRFTTPAQVRFACITFSNKVQRYLAFSDHQLLQNILSAVKNIKYTPGGSNMDTALIYARESIFPSSKRNSSKIIILLTDGESCSTQYTVSEATKMKNQGIKILSIGVGPGIYKNELQGIASKPSTDYVFTVSSFAALHQITNAVLNGTCRATHV